MDSTMGLHFSPHQRFGNKGFYLFWELGQTGSSIVQTEVQCIFELAFEFYPVPIPPERHKLESIESGQSIKKGLKWVGIF